MNSKSRSFNSLKNMIVGAGSQIIILLVTFLGRTVFIKYLGVEYLGVNGLYSNILTILSLAELGIGNVMIFSLYKPVADKDELKISALLNYYKKVYRLIALVILVLGLSMIPFLNHIVNSDISNNELVIYYILFLLNSVASYFVVYKTILINADQKLYVVKAIQTCVIILKEIVQIIVLLITQNYILYLCVLIISTLLNNIFMSMKADKLYPFIKAKNNVAEIDLKEINNNIKSSFFYKIGVVIMNNTDNILISSIIGTIYIGYYSNYNLLITAVATLIGILIQGVFSSLGNFNADGNMHKSYKMFNTLLLLFHWITACCSLCFLLVFNDFITIWIGNSYVLGSHIVIAIVINFYVQNIINPVWMYRETMGLFNQIKYIMLISSIINIVLSVIAGLKWGLAGILISTAISRMLTTVWYEPKILFETKFQQPVKNYWKRQLKYFLITAITTLGVLSLLSHIEPSLIFVFIKIIIGIIIMSIVFLITNYKSEEFLMLRKYLMQFKK